MAVCAAAAEANPGQTEWTANFHAFIKQLNRFIEAQNEGVFDAKQWKRVEEAWEALERK